MTSFAKSALLAMDLQSDIVNSYVPEVTQYLARVREVIAAARKSKLPVIYVTVAFRENHPEASPRNKSFSALKASKRFVAGSSGAEIHPELAPKPGDIEVVKRRVSAFAGSDLDVVLRSGGIEHLILCGIATSGVVLSTLRQAADLDFQLTVIEDCCADQDAEVHRVLTQKVFPRQAEVVSSKELLAHFQAAGS